MIPDSGMSVEEVVAARAAQWLILPGVAGVYAGEDAAGKPCITVMISIAPELLAGAIPATVEGYPVAFEDASDLRPMGGGAPEIA